MIEPPRDLPKPVKKLLRELVYRAHDAALRQALPDLCRQFERWNAGEIDAIEFTDKIHEFDSGPNREIWKRFTWSRNSDLQMLTAWALSTGLLVKADIPEPVLPFIESWLAFYGSIERLGR